jgi:protein disulfide-isomerase
LKKNFLMLTILVALFIGCAKTGATEDLSWQDNLEKALQQAKKENKAVLVNFTGSDWCIWCKRLTEEVFSKKEFETYAKKNLILVKLDFPRNIEQSTETKMYNNNLAQKFGIQGFPTILLFNSSGKLVLTTGYQPGGPATYVNHLKSYL